MRGVYREMWPLMSGVRRMKESRSQEAATTGLGEGQEASYW